MRALASLACFACLACNDKAPDPVKTPGQVGAEKPDGEADDGSEPPSDGPATDGPQPDSEPPLDPSAPKLLFDRNTQGPKALHPSERYLYWYESNLGQGARVLYAPKDGSSAPSVLSQTESLSSLGFIASDAEYVYWVEAERIFRAPHGGDAAPEAFALGRSFLFPYLASDAQALYVTDLGCFHIARVALPGFEVTMLRDEEGAHDGGVSVIVTDATHVYCSSGHLGTVVAVPKAGGPARELVRAAQNHGIAGIALADDALFLLQVPHSLGQPGQSIVKVSKETGASSVLATADVYGGGSLLLFAAERRALYWVDSTSVRASLHRLELASGTLSTLVRDRHLQSEIAIDEQRVYYVELDPSGIFTLSL